MPTPTRAILMFSRARQFRILANELYVSVKPLIDRPGPDIEEKAVAYVSAVVMLRGFAAECMLKAISLLWSGSFKCIHDLSKLYCALDETPRECIDELAASEEVASPKRVLEQHRKDFVRWRYPEPGTTLTTNLSDLDKVLGVLDTAYKQIEKSARRGG